MRLIDAESFLEAMEEYTEYNSSDYYKEEPFLNISFEQLEEIVAEQQTAYDPENTVAELEEKQNEINGNTSLHYLYSEGYSDAIDYSIDTVKKAVHNERRKQD